MKSATVVDCQIGVVGDLRWALKAIKRLRREPADDQRQPPTLAQSRLPVKLLKWKSVAGPEENGTPKLSHAATADSFEREKNNRPI